MFYRKEERLKFNAQVVILADCSGSMQGQREMMASISTYALARSLRKIPGIRTDVYYYSAVTFERALSQSDHISRFSRMQASSSFRNVSSRSKPHSRMSTSSSGRSVTGMPAV